MLVYPQGSDVPIRGDLLVRLVFRTDLTPIPATVEFEVRNTTETEKSIVEGSIIRMGADMTEFLLVKVAQRSDSGMVQGGRQYTTINAVGILNACAPIAQRMQRAVVRENSSLGEIYRACGATLRIDSDFTVPLFACFVGMVPSFEIAKVLQEEAGVLVYEGGKIKFRRLAELRDSKAQQTLAVDQVQTTQSGFLERHVVPFAFTTSPANAIVTGRRESARGAVYRPRGDQRIVNNLSIALVQRAKVRNGLIPGFNAGMRVDVGTVPHIAITAAHIYESGADGGTGDQYSQFWLGEVVA
jgi:hypothetical protein